jgi:hypothetical protein
MSQGSYRRQWATDVVVRQRRRDRSSGRIDELAADPAPASIGIAMANIRPSRCDCRQGTETGEAAPSLCRTASRCGAPASPLGGIFRRRTDNTAAVVHGYRPARKPPLVERSPEPASLRVRSNPGSRYRQDLRAGRSPSDRRSGSGHPHPSQSTAIPIASAFPQPAIEPTERTSRVVIPPFLWTLPLGTSTGSKLPSRSRGVSIRIVPSPVRTDLAVLPLRWLVTSSPPIATNHEQVVGPSPGVRLDPPADLSNAGVLRRQRDGRDSHCRCVGRCRPAA